MRDLPPQLLQDHVELKELLAVGAPDEPGDFADFWAGLYAQALDVATDPELTPIDGSPGTDLFKAHFTSLGGIRIGGWLALPADRRIERAVVVGHGYGGRDAPDLAVVPRHAAAIFPVARGQATMSLLPGVPPDSQGHVLVGIDSRDTYIHGGCAADIWCAASALGELLPDKPQRLGYFGGSFGGGIGALALPWDHRFTAAVLKMPSFGNHDVRLTIRCDGSGEAVRQHVASHPEVREVLRYFDSATAARRISIPVLVGLALRDAVVPAPGQFAVFNALPESGREIYVFTAGHAEYDGAGRENDEFLRVSKTFLER